MSEKRNEYRKSGSSEDSDEETRDEENNEGSNSGSGHSSGSESDDGTASESSAHSGTRGGRSSRGSQNRQSSDDDDAAFNNGAERASKRTTSSMPKEMVAGSPKRDESQHSNNSRTNGGCSNDVNSDSESNSDSNSSSSNTDSNDEQDSAEEISRRAGRGGSKDKGLGNNNDNIMQTDKKTDDTAAAHNTSGTSVTNSSTSTTNTTTTSNTSYTAKNREDEGSDAEYAAVKNANNSRSDKSDDDATNNESNDDESDSDKDELNNKSQRHSTRGSSSKLSAISKPASRQPYKTDDEDGTDEQDSDKGSDAESSKSSAEEDEDDDNEDDDMESQSQSSSSSSQEDEEDDYKPKRSTRQIKKPPSSQDKAKKPQKKKQKQNWESDESGDSDTDDDSDDSAPRKRKAPATSNKSKQQKQQSRGGGGGGRSKKRADDSDDSDDETKRCGTRRTAAAVSYKEASEDEKTDSEDLLDYEYDEAQAEAAAAAQEEEDKSETIERVLAQRMGKKGHTGNQTTIYAMEETEQDPNASAAAGKATADATSDGQQNVDNENTEVQYHIKWKGWSYIHNTWESEETLREQKAKGMKKLENFIKKEQDIEYWRRYAGPEDIDYFECQLELQNELLKSYNNVDRIIARSEKEDGTCEYLCKWQSLPYAESTWEDASLVLQKWQQCVQQFEERENSKCTPSRQCKVLRHRPKFYRIKDQPEFLHDSSLILRDYQLDGLNWLLHSWCKENSVILADEMGLGKTIQTICFLNSLFKLHHLYGPFLCVVPLSTMTAWQREFQLWAPELNVVTYLGDVKSREMIRQYEWQFNGSKRLKFNCILTTYEIVLKDKLFLGTLQWAALLVDEAHRLKNDDSLLYKSLKEFETNHRLLITGTPLQNSLKELWALLHFIMPEKFVTWEDFELEHGNAADKGYTRLHQQLEPFILRRVKKDVEKSLPAKVEQILRVEMTSVQKQYYKWILTKNFDALRKGKRGSTSTFLNIVIELKKCCNHAALIRPSEFELMGMQQEEALQTLLKGSGKLVLLDKLLCRLRDTGHRVLIFSQMVRMLDVLADYLQKRHFPFQRLDGSIKGEMRRQALDHFNAEGSQDFCFLLSTRAGGLGINLATADTVIIFDSDWNPQNDLQAQARAHRIGQKNQVNIYRLVTARSVEEQIVERAKQKMVLDHLVIQRMDTTGRTVLDKSGGSSSNSNPFDKDDLSAILKFGAEELFKDEQENDDELVCDIDEILRRAETRNEDPEMPGDDLLSAFKVASIVAFEEEPDAATKNESPENDIEEDTKDWDDIIPEDFRKIVEEKERAKEMEDLYLPPRRKTATNNQMDSTPTKRGKKSQQDDSADSDYDAGSDASGEGADGRSKRRGRPGQKEKIAGFTDAELRRFIRSYRKFPAPMLRLEAIACDAELQEKPLAELKRIGQMLHDRCVQFLEEHKEEPPPQPTAPAANKVAANGGTEDSAAAAAAQTKQKRNRQTYSIKLGGVSFNAKTLLTAEEELKPLNEIIPNSANERLTWSLDLKTRPANFDTDWGIEEDSKLLCGIYQYGIGSWEQMKLDPSLKLEDKILFNDTRKPQAKHLQSRAEYLLKTIKKNLELKKKGPKGRQRKPRKPKEAKGNDANATAAGTPENRSRRVSETHGFDATSQSATGSAKPEYEHENGANDIDMCIASSKKKRKSNAGGKTGKGAKKTKSSGAAGKKANKPMHFTANNEPRALDVLGDLDPTIFNECKEKMRPVKRALKALDRPDSSLTNQEQVKHTRDCLLSIGKQIDTCLEAYNEADKKVWRSNLWYFVSKFTEHDAKKLFKIYKTLKESTTTKTSDAKSSPAKSSTQSPAKKSKDNKNANDAKDKGKPPNGTITPKEKKKDKNKDKDEKAAKKKKKDKERDFDKAKTHATTSALGSSDRFTAKGVGADIGDKQRNDAVNKRKRDASDFNDSKSFKRVNVDGRGSRDRNEDRKKHHRDDYYGSGNSHDGIGGRRDILNSPSSANNRSMSERSRLSSGGSVGGGNAGNYRDRTTSGGDSRQSFAEGGNDRWGGHGRDRYGNSDYKRDRYDSYNNRSGGGGGGGGYHHRGNRDRRPEKRRYPPNLPPHALNYPGHYPPPMPPGFFMANGVLPPPPAHAAGMFRGDMRYSHAPNEWSSRDSRMDFSPEYRRSATAGVGAGGAGAGAGTSGGGSSSGDYDRRTQT